MSVAGEKTNYLYKYKCWHLIEASHAGRILMIARLSKLFLMGAPVIWSGALQSTKTISPILCDSLDMTTRLLPPK